MNFDGFSPSPRFLLSQLIPHFLHEDDGGAEGKAGEQSYRETWLRERANRRDKNYDVA